MAYRTLQTSITVWLLGGAAALSGDWTHYAGDAARSSHTVGGPWNLSNVRWTAQPQADEEFVARATPVAAGNRVIASARVFEDFVQSGNRLIAYHAQTGTREWEADLDPDILDSWSSPAIDVRNNTVLVASDETIYAFDLADGTKLWQTTLAGSVVNASIAVTNDVFSGNSPANRLFITDHAPSGTGLLYAINIDPFAAIGNPYFPGEIAWTHPINGTSGNSAAYADGRVYVASRFGQTMALEADDGSVVWSMQTSSQGFFGGVCISGSFVFAATYNFNGAQNNSRMYKIDAVDGHTVWSIPCERTSSIPVVAPDGRIFLSGGIAGFGSAVKLQAFRDFGASASLLWDTYAGSGGSLAMGGWTFQPVLAAGILYAGRPGATGDFGAYDRMYILNTALTPGASGFLVSQSNAVGGSPAIVGTWLYSIGPDGLSAVTDSVRIQPVTREGIFVPYPGPTP